MYIPVDYRVYYKANDDKTKNEHFRDMLRRAKQRGFTPSYVLMDTWYSSIDNLKLVSQELKWHFICNLKENRKVSISQGDYISIADLGLTDKQVSKVWLNGYGFVLVCKIVHKNGDIKYLATDNLELTDYDEFTKHFAHRWEIEEFHRGIKQTTGIEKCYSIKASSQKTQSYAAFTAFIKLEVRRLKEHVSWYEQKAQITRPATISYLNLSIA